LNPSPLPSPRFNGERMKVRGQDFRVKIFYYVL